MYHFGTFEGRIYLTMQWVDGPTLAKVIRRDAPLPLETTLAIGRKLASALEAAHSRKTLHRDIKPQNVLIDRAGEPLITDFGLARLKGEPGITRNGVFLGTPNYASPEQCQLRPVDERSDIYALGLVLFEMATGHRPFEADSASEALEMHRSAPPPDPRELEPGVPPELSTLILRCLKKDPAERYPTATALREAVEAIG
jgi:serine/threonine-protein kinase